ncbi:hypothetical protein R5R35_009985 [Gryllus longicercus]|uniref:lysozyme n=1 Tax=Gryllus longicercus TaxID=2509291 RepID=A0AAN9Z9Z2_9ORTH
MVAVATQAKTEEAAAWLPALHRACLRCLCEAATGCDARIGCVKGYCGPFKVSRLYWMEAGNITLPNDDPERAGAYEDCARQYMCSSRLVTSYMSKLKKDCNGDGLINCDDFALIHFNGGYSCEQPLNQSKAGQLYAARYERCRPKDDDPDPLGRTVLSK